MTDPSDFKRSQIVSMAGASVTKTAQTLNISRGTVSKVIKAFEKHGKHLHYSAIPEGKKSFLIGIVVL